MRLYKNADGSWTQRIPEADWKVQIMFYVFLGILVFILSPYYAIKNKINGGRR